MVGRSISLRRGHPFVLYCDPPLETASTSAFLVKKTCFNPIMPDPNRQIERLTTLDDRGHEDARRDTTAVVRWNMVWQLTIEEYARKGIDITNQPMCKDVERLIRLDQDA